MYLVLERRHPALSTYFEFTVRFKNKQMKYPNPTMHPEAFVASCPVKRQSCSWTQLAISKVCRRIPWNTQHYWQNSYLGPDARASDCSGRSSTLHHTKHLFSCLSRNLTQFCWSLRSIHQMKPKSTEQSHRFKHSLSDFALSFIFGLPGMTSSIRTEVSSSILTEEEWPGELINPVSHFPFKTFFTWQIISKTPKILHFFC